MATKIGAEEVKRINEIYAECRTYAETARRLGMAPSTVKKYVIPGWVPVDKAAIRHFNLSMIPEFDTSMFYGVDNYGDLCVLSDAERDEIKELWKELDV